MVHAHHKRSDPRDMLFQQMEETKNIKVNDMFFFALLSPESDCCYWLSIKNNYIESTKAVQPFTVFFKFQDEVNNSFFLKAYLINISFTWIK